MVLEIIFMELEIAKFIINDSDFINICAHLFVMILLDNNTIFT